MNCLKCGAQNVDGALFCTKCGSPLESTQSATVIDAPTSSESASAPQPISSASPYAQGTSSGGYSSSTYSSPGPLGVESNKDWMGIVSLVCGIASLPCCFTCFGGLIVGAVAIVFGILGINTRNRPLAIAGIVCGSIGALLGLFMLLFSVAASPSVTHDSNLRDFYGEIVDDFQNV